MVLLISDVGDWVCNCSLWGVDLFGDSKVAVEFRSRGLQLARMTREVLGACNSRQGMSCIEAPPRIVI